MQKYGLTVDNPIKPYYNNEVREQKGGAKMEITLKAARINKNLTQEEAGKLIGVSADVISNWERAVSFPDVLQLKAIEKAYGVEYKQLIFLPA